MGRIVISFSPKYNRTALLLWGLLTGWWNYRTAPELSVWSLSRCTYIMHVALKKMANAEVSIIKLIILTWLLVTLVCL